MSAISDLSGTSSTIVNLLDENGEIRGSGLELPLCTSTKQLQSICNLQDQEKHENSEDFDELLDSKTPYEFYIDGHVIDNDKDILSVITKIAEENKNKIVDFIERKNAVPTYDLESAIKITCLPQEIYRIRPVSRCTSSIPGHEEAITSMIFSPDGKNLASGSGDTNVRTWNLNSQVPDKTLSAHKNHIQALAFSLDNKFLVSADKTGVICVWNYKKGTLAKGPLRGHRNYVNQICFQPLHLNCPSKLFVSCSKDCTAKVWDCVSGQLKFTLSGHNKSVQAAVWSGENVILTGAQDRTVKLWNGETGQMIRSLQEHAHWVNSIALSSESLLKTGAFDPINQIMHSQVLPHENEKLQNLAKIRWDKFNQKHKEGEKFVSCSDDFTICLWSLRHTKGNKRALDDNANNAGTAKKKPIARMTGHQNVVMSVKFSPDTRLIASCALDRSVRLWDGNTGKFLSRLTGHVSSVYQICWSPDSRLLLSCSADSTLKLWTMKTQSFHSDLPGHSDEVYAIDWSNCGGNAASGGKDKLVKIWKR